jgi:hypothetical protein
VGVYYQVQKPTFHDILKDNLPLLKEYAPVDLPYYEPGTMRANTDLSSAVQDYVV